MGSHKKDVLRSAIPTTRSGGASITRNGPTSDVKMTVGGTEVPSYVILSRG